MGIKWENTLGQARIGESDRGQSGSMPAPNLRAINTVFQLGAVNLHHILIFLAVAVLLFSEFTGRPRHTDSMGLSSPRA